MDVNYAYLNADLEEPTYMKQPQGYTNQSSHHVLKLKKAMYGLKLLRNLMAYVGYGRLRMGIPYVRRRSVDRVAICATKERGWGCRMCDKGTRMGMPWYK